MHASLGVSAEFLLKINGAKVYPIACRLPAEGMKWESVPEGDRNATYDGCAGYAEDLEWPRKKWQTEVDSRVLAMRCVFMEWAVVLHIALKQLSSGVHLTITCSSRAD